MDVLNPNPVVYDIQTPLRRGEDDPSSWNDDETEPFDALEVYELLRSLKDPEHPQLTLEQLKVVDYSLLDVKDDTNYIRVFFTPTVPHCTMATVIGLCIRIKLLRSLPNRFKVDVFITPGSHSLEKDVNKQLNDKERVAAALENKNLLDMINGAIGQPDLDD